MTIDKKIAAAILGGTNMGLPAPAEHLVNGLRKFAHPRRSEPSLDKLVILIWFSYIEGEEVLETFVAEAGMWIEEMNKMDMNIAVRQYPILEIYFPEFV